MAAANTDKFKKGARKWVGQIGAAGVADDSVTTVPLTSATGLPTDTAVEVVIDRVDSAGAKTPTLEETAIGVVSGTNLVTCTRGAEGTAQAHSGGAVVEVLITANMWEDLIDGILVDHDQTGQHGGLTDANGNEWIKQTATASAVNEFTVANAVTGSGPIASVTGGDTNIDLNLVPKGTGEVKKRSSVEFYVVEGTTDVATGDGQFYFTVPEQLNGMNLSAVHARVITAGTTGTSDIQIRNVTDSSDMLSTVITIDTTETGSDTAAAAAVIDAAEDDVVTNDLIAIDVDAVSTTAPKGLIVRLEFDLA